MKKQILCLFLGFILLIGMVGCSKEPVPFSEDLKNNKNCYLDTVEIQPLLDDGIYLYCKCTQENGNIVWMRILDSDYQEYFDTADFEDSSDYYDYLYKGVKYHTAVRLMGTVKKIQNVMENKDAKVKVFDFTEADTKDTLNSAEQSYYGTAYATSLPADRYVYADITRIAFTGKVTQSSFSVSSAVYECTLTSGQTISIDISVSHYKTYFDKTATFTTNSLSLSSSSPDPIDFVQPVRIYGITTDSKTNAFTFRAASIDAIEAAKIENQPAIEFSDTAKDKQKVYVTLQSIEPKYTVTNILNTNIPGTEYYVCRSVCTNGKVVWICMYAKDFKNYFLNTFVESNWENIKVELDQVVVNGTVKHADNLANALSEKIGTEKVIVFHSKA